MGKMVISGTRLFILCAACFGLGGLFVCWLIVGDIHRQVKAIYRRYHPQGTRRGRLEAAPTGVAGAARREP
jgi:hypothetical protein